MNLLHTSDWHLGQTLYGKNRYAECEAFLAWLAETLQRHEIRTLLVAGDVFDTSTPSNRAQALYYRFLCRVAASSSCRHVVVIAGNHDSPSFLDAPRELLKVLDVHVVGSASDDPEDEVLVLCDEQGVAELIVCAVPYLRDRNIRVAEAGEAVEEKEQKRIDGIRRHYARVAALAEHKRRECGTDIPIVAMGHLFVAGGKTLEGDGVRELYIGSLGHVSAGIFPDNVDYLALGHLHAPQTVNGLETLQYSGAPLPMGFGEAGQQKCVCRVDFQGRAASVHRIPVPVFQALVRIQGDWNSIHSRLFELAETGSRIWLEIIYDGKEVVGDLWDRLETVVSGTSMEILRVKNTRLIDRVLKQHHDAETLDDLNANDVFHRCLAAHEVPEDQRPDLFRAYRETLLSLHEDDLQAE